MKALFLFAFLGFLPLTIYTQRTTQSLPGSDVVSITYDPDKWIFLEAENVRHLNQQQNKPPRKSYVGGIESLDYGVMITVQIIEGNTSSIGSFREHAEMMEGIKLRPEHLPANHRTYADYDKEAWVASFTLQGDFSYQRSYTKVFKAGMLIVHLSSKSPLDKDVADALVGWVHIDESVAGYGEWYDRIDFYKVGLKIITNRVMSAAPSVPSGRNDD